MENRRNWKTNYDEIILRRLNGENIPNENHFRSHRIAKLQYKSIKTIKRNTFNGFNGLDRLDLSNNELRVIESNSFDNLKYLEYLGLHINSLDNIDQKLFQNLGNLKTLYLSSNRIESISEGTFDGLINLQVLYLNGNYLTTLPKNLFQNLQNLNNLMLLGNYIGELDENLFKKLSSLKKLHLSHNRLKKLERHLFDDLSALTYLDILDNEIEDIDCEAFKNLKNLQELFLHKNKIKLFESNLIFSTLKNLVHINLSSNQIELIDTSLFNPLNSLKKLNLSNNYLKSIQFDVCLLSLEELSLDNNLLTSFNVNALTELKNLYLFNNQISRLDGQCFSNLKNLKKLYLFGNQIEYVDEDTFKGLLNLKQLRLSSNKLEFIEPGLFSDLCNLKELNLFNNKISELKSNVFSSLKELKYLFLSGNRINVIENDVFCGLVEMKILLLDHNFIENTNWLVTRSFPKLEILNLSSNNIEKLKANCLNSLKELYLFNNKIKYFERNYFENLKALNVFDIDNNLIENLNVLRYLVENCLNLKELYLKNNPISSISDQENRLLERVLRNKCFEKLSIDSNLIGVESAKIIKIEDDLYREFKNQFYLLNAKRYFSQEIESEAIDDCPDFYRIDEKSKKWIIKAIEFSRDESMYYFNSIPDSINFNQLKTNLKMFSLIVNEEKVLAKNLLKTIQNQNQTKNFLIESLELEYASDELIIDPQENEAFKVIDEINIQKYRESISKYLINKQLKEINTEMQNNKDFELKKGYTSKFIHIQENSCKFEPDNESNRAYFTDINENELVFLINKIGSNELTTKDQINNFLKRQLLKKIYFNNLNILLNLDIIYGNEIKNLNDYLAENDFDYSIIQPKILTGTGGNRIMLHQIRLFNRRKRYQTELNSLSAREKLKFHLLILKRDRDIIKANFKDIYQILLIDDIDYLCDNNRLVFDDAITMIRSNLVNYMNIQVVALLGNVSLLDFNNQCVMQIYKDQNLNQIVLKNYEAHFGNRIIHEREYLDERRRRIENFEKVELKNKNKMLEEKVSSIEREFEGIKALRSQDLDKIETLTRERDLIKETLTQAFNKTSQQKQQQQVENVREIFSTQTIDIEKFFAEFQNKELTENDAKAFIELLQSERNNLNGFAKQMICGSIKNLTSSLYTSSIHYIYELLQNFEDSFEDSGINEPCVKITFNKDYILFASNESGFTLNDVQSICRLSVSNKQLNKHIGNKGIGFKSVSLCTNNPIIVSNSIWKFEFRLNDNDNLSYITPYHLTHLPNELQMHIEHENDLNTFIFLPFKELYDDKYFENLLNSVDKNILLFTKNISKLIINDKINNKEFCIRREFQAGEDSWNQNIKIVNAKLYVGNRVCENYRMFKADRDIVFAFPLDFERNYQTYSVFPIYDLKLKFLFSCHWNLVTNRETVNEHNAENLQLKDRLLKHIFDIFKNDEVIRKHLFKYLPSLNTDLIFWWKAFLIGFIEAIKPLIEANYSNLRVFDETLNRLVDKNLFKLINIDIIDDENRFLADNYEIQRVSIKDLLKLLESKEQSLIEWHKNLHKDWWQKLFQFFNLNKKAITDKSLFYRTKLFLHDNDSIREVIINNDKYFLRSRDDLDLICSNHNIVLIRFQTNDEKIFLKESLNINELDEKSLIEIILDDQMNGRFTRESLFYDLEFIKNNLEIFKIFIEMKSDYILHVPVVTNGNRKEFSSIEHSTIPTLFSLDFSSPLGVPLTDTKSSYYFIDYSKQSLKECLENEIFYLKLNAQLPQVNTELLKGKIDLNEMTLPLLKEFSLFTNADVELAEELFSLIKDDYIKKVIYKLPVRVVGKNNIIARISDVFINTRNKLENTSFNFITVPFERIELAKKFGAKETLTESLTSTITELPALAENLVEDTENKIDLNEVAQYERTSNHHFRRENRLFSINFNSNTDVASIMKILKEKVNKIENIVKTETELENIQPGLNILFNFEERINTGIIAELYFYLYLQKNYKNSLDIENCWVSSLRGYIFKNLANCDDTKGYDFILDDYRNLFSKDSSKKCLIEVKGFAYSWNRTFVLTKNELNRKNLAKTNGESYIVVIIENVNDFNKIRIVKIINWTENENYLKLLEAEAYKFIYVE